MAYAQKGPFLPTIAIDAGGGTAWTGVTNVFANDGIFASASISNAGDQSGYIQTKGYGFQIPQKAVIDGIQIQFNRKGVAAATRNIQLLKAGVATVFRNGTDIWPVNLAFVSYGNETDLWGTTWTPADINDPGFGFGLQVFNLFGGGSGFVDAMYITVSYHFAAADVQKHYEYKVYNNTGNFVGTLPDVISEFTFSQEINTVGSQTTITVAQSADTAGLSPTTIDDQTGIPLQDEAGNNFSTEGTSPIVNIGTGGDSLIKNGNQVFVYEYGYYYPNGRIVFRGVMERWEAKFGGEDSDNAITILVYSDGSDMDNFIVRGAPYTYTQDQGQINQDTALVVSTATDGSIYNYYGQTWTVGAGVVNLSRITVGMSGTANVTVSVYYGSQLLGSSYQSISVIGLTAVRFPFSVPIVTTPGGQYSFTVQTDKGQSITIYALSTNPYSGGTMTNASYSGRGGSFLEVQGSDLFFTTDAGSGSTIGSFTNQDPTTGMLVSMLNDYITVGGKISYNTNTIDATGLSLSYKFTTNTVYEGIRTILDLSPKGYYYYTDLGTDTLYFKNSSSTPDVYLIKGAHIEDINFIATIESTKNVEYFTGGATAGVNLYKSYTDSGSILRYGQRLDRKTDNRVTVAITADAIGISRLSELKDEQYQTTIKIVDKTMDTSTLIVGKIVGLRGFGTFIDNLQTQIVRVDYSPEEITLGLGIIPKRLHPEFEKITRGLLAEQTIANPTAPS